MYSCTVVWFWKANHQCNRKNQIGQNKTTNTPVSHICLLQKQSLQNTGMVRWEAYMESWCKKTIWFTVDTKIQNEMTEGRCEGVKVSGTRSCEGGFHYPHSHCLSHHLGYTLTPHVSAPPHIGCHQSSRNHISLSLCGWCVAAIDKAYMCKAAATVTSRQGVNWCLAQWWWKICNVFHALDI